MPLTGHTSLNRKYFSCNTDTSSIRTCPFVSGLKIFDCVHSLFTLGSAGKVVFTGLRGGRYVLKIFAYNRQTDVATAKMVVNV